MNLLITKLLIIIFFTTSLVYDLQEQQSHNSSGQTRERFDLIGLEQGLSQSTINTIVQDAFGFMWFGSDDGLNRYDGYTISVFRHDPTDSTSIADNTITCMLSDRKGDLWIGTMYGGLNRFVLHENRFIHYKHSESNPETISENYITSLFEDSNDNLWISTRNKGLNRFNPSTGKFLHYESDRENNLSISSNETWSICEDHSGDIWIATADGLSRLKGNFISKGDKEADIKFLSYRNNASNKHSLSNNGIRSVYVDKKGILWAGTYNGVLNSFDEQNNIFKRYFLHDDKPDKQVKCMITSICDDSKGNLWIASEDGIKIFDRDKKIFRDKIPDIANILFSSKSGIIWIGTYNRGVLVYDWRRNQFRNYDIENIFPNNESGNMIISMHKETNGNLWIGTWNGGLYRLDNERKKVTSYNLIPKDENNFNTGKIFSLSESKGGNIWIAAGGAGLFLFNKSTGRALKMNDNSAGGNKNFSQIFRAYEDRNSKIWIGTDNGFYSFDIKTKKFSRLLPNENNPGKFFVIVIHEDTFGEIWIGTQDNGLYRFIPQQNLFKKYSLTGKYSSNIFNNNVYSVYRDSSGIVWTGTWGGGLNRLDPETGAVKNYTHKQGLPNDVIYSILPDKSGNLWLSTNKGISKFNTASETFINFDVKDGLQANEFSQGAYFEDSNGELFFGGIKGFNSFFPEDIGKNNYVPPVYLTTLKVFNKTLPLPNPVTNGKSIELSYSQNFFSFEFVALNYTSPDKNQYAYMLEGFDKEWHTVNASQRFGSYTNLDPGKYILKVKGSNNDGVWNETGSMISIIVTPPFWMTWWFSGIVIAAFLSIGPIFYYQRGKTLKKEKEHQQEISRRMIEKQEEERTRIAQEMHDGLGQELLIIKNRSLLALQKPGVNEAIEKDLRQISDDASKVLRSIRDISHNLRPPELDRLGLTETLRSILLTVRESAKIKVNGEVEGIDGLLPANGEISIVRIVQEALGNIIKHSEATECGIYINRDNNHIQLDINDNGKGFNSSLSKNKSSGLGLTGISERVRILAGTFDIDSFAGKGTRLKIRIPVQTVKNNLC